MGEARLKLYKGKTHTKPSVEDPSEHWLLCPPTALASLLVFGCCGVPNPGAGCWLAYHCSSPSAGAAARPAAGCTRAAAVTRAAHFVTNPGYFPLHPAVRGGRDELMDDVLSMVLGRQCHNLQLPMLPAALIDLASWVCPF